MRANSVPVAWFLRKPDAEALQRRMGESGIASHLEDSRPAKNTGEQPGYVIRVEMDVLEQARALYRETLQGSGEMLCARCGKRPATVHMTQIQNGQQVTRHYCADCQPT